MEFFIQDTLMELTAAFGQLPRGEINYVASIMELRHVRRGETFLRAGNRSIEIAVVVDGLFKMHGTSRSGSPYVVAFADEGMIVSDYVASLSQRPATITIEAVETSWLAVLKIDRLQELFERDASWHAFARKVLESQLSRLSRREFEFLTMTAAERYQAFVQAHTKVVPRVSRQDMAAYLGITPVSLSRISAQIHEAKRGMQPRSD